VAGTATPELVCTATTDAVQRVHVYGLTRLKDANECLDEGDTVRNGFMMSLFSFKNGKH